jgi:hypothetical protein
MLSVVVAVLNARGASPLSAEAVVRTLSALVPAVIEGVLRDVTLAAPSGHPEMRKIADHAGCELVEGEGAELLRMGVESARGPNIFLLRAGRAPESGFAEEISDALGRTERSALLREAPMSPLTRIAPGFAPLAGLMAQRDRLLAVSGGTLGAYARAVKPAITLRTRARLVE